MVRRFVLVLTTLLLVADTAAGHEFAVGDLIITHPWARVTATANVPGVGYLAIENTGTDDDRLLGAASPVVARVELHRTVIEDGIARMRPPPDGLALPAGAIIELAPGGYHLMLTGLTAPLTTGARVPLTLRFERAGEVAIEIVVE